MQTYEDLLGGEGRLIYYRAERFRVKDLFGALTPRISVAGQPLALEDISMSGIAALDGRGAEWSRNLGRRVLLRLRTGADLLHESLCEVTRAEATPFGVRVAFRLIDAFIDVPGLVARHEVAAIKTELSMDLEAEVDKVAPGYRQLCADVLHLTRANRAVLGRLAETAPAGSSDAGNVPEEVLWHAEQQCLPRWRSLWFQANEMLWPLIDDPEAYRAAKRYTELVLTPEFLPGPIWRRGYEKPLGYPGDYMLMHQIYRRSWEGDTPYGKLLHRLGLDVGEFVANRMVMMKAIIADTVAGKPAGARARITSLGSGPAHEVVSYLEAEELPRAVSFTLIDQDHQALTHAYRETRARALPHGDGAEMQCLHLSFMQLLKAGSVLQEMPPQDLIYSVGLLDYLAEKRARTLVDALYEQLAPGGRLVIGNVKRSAEASLWPLEFIADWNLIYRSEADMRRLAANLDPAKVELSSDATDRVVMIVLTKPGH